MNTTKTTPKDFFLHLGATTALYASAIALINLAFSTVNYALPDALAGYFSVSSVVWPISTLIVLIPILYVLEWVIRRDIVKIPEKREVWIRRWRIYLTLFLTGATIAGDLIALINTYLNGEISARFIYKILIVLVISAVIFSYYILERMSDSGRSRKFLILLAWVGIILTVAAIVAGFVFVGSPATQRAIRFDQLRINDLSNIQGSVAHYWQELGSVPESLAKMPEFMGSVPKDPETHAPYSYESGSQTNSFIICATFSATSTQENLNSPYVTPTYNNAFYNWSHGSGEVCFNRTISPVDFPPVQRPIPAKGI